METHSTAGGGEGGNLVVEGLIWRGVRALRVATQTSCPPARPTSPTSTCAGELAPDRELWARQWRNIPDTAAVKWRKWKWKEGVWPGGSRREGPGSEEHARASRVSRSPGQPGQAVHVPLPKRLLSGVLVLRCLRPACLLEQDRFAYSLSQSSPPSPVEYGTGAYRRQYNGLGPVEHYPLL